MRKNITIYLLPVALLFSFNSLAAVYYSDPAAGTANYNTAIWGTASTGPFTTSGTAITTSDDVVIQGGTIAINVASPARNMQVNGGATVTISIATTFTGDVTVQSGGVILLGPAGSNTGALSLQNLFIDAGGKIWGNDPVNAGATNIKTIRINGTTLQCNGTIGDGANADALLLQPEGAAVTFTGSGNIDVAGIRKAAATNATTSLTIDANINCRLGTTCVYSNQNNSTFNITINAGKTLKCIGIANPTGFPGTEGSISLNGTTGGSTRRQGLVTINGRLECDNLYLAATSTTATDVFKYLVTGTGTLQVNTQLKGNNATASTSATADLELQSGATLRLGGTTPTANVEGAMLKNKFIFDANSTVEYFGNAQTIENNFGDYRKLVINTSGAIATVNDVIVTTKLTLLNGVLGTSATGEMVITASDAAAVEANNQASYVTLPFTRSITAGVPGYVFPIGSGAVSAGFVLNNLSTSVSVLGTYSTAAFGSNPANPLFISNTGFWSIQVAMPAAISGTVTLRYNNGYPVTGVSNHTQMVNVSHDGTAFSNLGRISSTGTASSGSVTSNFTQFGMYMLGTTTALLPITLHSFDVTKESNGVAKISWKVSNQGELKNFVVEKSIDGVQFSALRMVTPDATNTAPVADYTSFDYNCFQPTAYFRLKMIDRNGMVHYSNIVRITNAAAGIKIFHFAPGSVFIASPGISPAMAKVYNMQGQLLLTQRLVGSYSALQYQQLPKGEYVLVVESDTAPAVFNILR